MRAAVVLGANGQDGTFLVQHLLRSGSRVVGADLAPLPRMAHGNDRFRYVQLDLRNRGALQSLLREVQPARIYHVAAIHLSSAGSRYEQLFPDMLAVNVESAHSVLEHIRTENLDARLLYASSAKVFGNPLPPKIDENTPRTGSCLYSITKCAAGDLVSYYRREHGIRASTLFLFNHESELRPPDFFVPKLVAALTRAMRGDRSAARTRFRSLAFYCDWGSAEEYMEIAVEALERAPGEDFVVATGACEFARDLVDRLFAAQGQSPDLYVEEASGNPTDRPTPYRASTEKLLRLVGRRPQGRVQDLVLELARSTLQQG